MIKLIFVLLFSILFVSCENRKQKQEVHKPFTSTGIVVSKEPDISAYFVGVLIEDENEYIRVPFNVDFRHGDTLEMKAVWSDGNSDYIYYYQKVKKRKI